MPAFFFVYALLQVAALCFVFDIGGAFAQDAADPCSMHTTLSESWRNINSGSEQGTDHCDNSLTEGWYAFKLSKDPAKIPTQCLQDHSCGAKVPFHVEYEGTEEIALDEVRNASLCGTYNVLGQIECCVLKQSIQIKRCPGDVFIYKLSSQKFCPAAFCAQKLSEEITPSLLAMPGDRPRSLGPAPSTTVAANPATSTGTTESTTAEIITRSLVMLPTGASSSSSPQPSLWSSSSLAPLSTTTLAANDNETSTILQLTNNGTDGPVEEDTNITSTDNVTDSSNMTSAATLSDQDETDDVTNFTTNTTASADMTQAVDLPQKNNSEQMNTTTTLSDKFLQSSSSTTTATNSTLIVQGTSIKTPIIIVADSTTTTILPLSSAKSDARTAATAAATAPSTTTPSPAGRTTPRPTIIVTARANTARPEASSSPATPRQQQNEAVRFVVQGEYKESVFRDWLVAYVNNISKKLTGKEQLNITEFHITAEPGSSDRLITYVDTNITDPLTNTTFPAHAVVLAIRDYDLTELLLEQTNLTLANICPARDSCEMTDIEGSTGTEDRSLFNRNQGLFIAIIVIGAGSLLFLLLALFVLRWRKQGTWVLASENEVSEKDQPLGIESPMTDSQIKLGEERPAGHHSMVINETVLTNGHRSHTPDDIPAADEDNGWVVPLDQAYPPPPVPVHISVTVNGGDGSFNPRTEDTQF